jgi:sialic acid synthase SpsE
MRTLYEKARTPLEWFPALFEYAAQTGIVAFSSVFGIESLAALEDVGAPAYKIAHQEAHQRALLETVALTEKPMIVSLRAPVSWIMDTVAATLYCPGEYPCAAEDVHLPEFGMPGFVGLSSHCRGIELPIAAVARGCKLIEMHFELAEAPSELESNVSLNQHEFGNMVNGVRNTEVLLA